MSVGGISEGRSHHRGLSREGRVVCRHSFYSAPGIYTNLLGRDGAQWREAGAHPFPLSGIEASAIRAFAQHFHAICIPNRKRTLAYVRLQFDGMDFAIRPPPGDFAATSDQAIDDVTASKGSLVRMARRFFSGQVGRGPVNVERISSPPCGSSMYGDGNCIILAIF